MTYLILILSLFISLPVMAQAAGDAAAGKAKFDMLCAACHGASGKGDGAASAALNPKPRDLTLTTKTDDELKKTIKEGGVAVGLSTTMPAWGTTLTDPDIANVVAYIRSLKTPKQ